MSRYHHKYACKIARKRPSGSTLGIVSKSIIRCTENRKLQKTLVRSLNESCGEKQALAFRWKTLDGHKSKHDLFVNSRDK